METLVKTSISSKRLNQVLLGFPRLGCCCPLNCLAYREGSSGFRYSNHPSVKWLAEIKGPGEFR